MKKLMGFATGLAAVGLMGAGFYMLMSDKTKKQMGKTLNSAMDDANRMVNKKVNAMSKSKNMG